VGDGDGVRDTDADGLPAGCLVGLALGWPAAGELAAIVG
jgi:hypothetical protein